MSFDPIVLQSAGSLSVAVMALFMLIVQAAFFLKRPQFVWYAWGAAMSFSALLYAMGIFFEYNTPPGSLNRFAGLLEWMAIIFLIHSLYGFTFSYLGIKSKGYHIIAGAWHTLILILLWSTDYIVARTFISRHFVGLSTPFVEPALGPLGPLFVLYAVLASVGGIILWFRRKGPDPRERTAYLAGMIFWFLLAVHDALASLGMPSLQYLMEYGFLGFSIAVLWVVFSSFLEKTAQEKYRVITQLANDCIMVVQDERMVFANPACTALIDRPAEDSEAGEFLAAVLEEDKKAVLDHYNRLLNGDNVPQPLTVRMAGSNGEERSVEIGASVIQFRNRPAILAIIRDVTEKKRREEALRENEKKLARLKKMESLGLLAGGVAHDLNNVLSGIVSYPELLLLELPEASTLRKPIETMHESGKRATAIVQDLLTVARGAAITRGPLNLNEIIKGYLESPEHKRLEKFHPTVTIHAALAPRLLNISGSQVHIRKAVMNLVSNASEAIETAGNVTVRTMNRYLDKPLKGYDQIKVGEYAVLAVSDEGSGISSEDLDRIFEPFYSKKVMGRSGTGLGLSLVWNVVQDHEGYIDVSSDQKGTTFELYFPITREATSEKELTLPLEELYGNGESILVVDDVASQREIACKMLEKLGYKPEAVSSGEGALAYLKEHPVNLVLLDMIMDPGMNGLETYRSIVEIYPGQKAVIVSGYAETDDVKEAQNLGAGEYIKKPVSLETLGLALKKELIKS